MDYNNLCKIIDNVHGTPGNDKLCQTLILEYISDYINGLNTKYIQEGFIPENGFIYFNSGKNQLQIGREPIWTLAFPINNIKGAFEKFENRKEEIAKEADSAAKLYHNNMIKIDSEAQNFLNKIYKEKVLIELEEKKYLNFKHFSIQKQYDYNGLLTVSILYNFKILHAAIFRLFDKLDEINIKQEFKAGRAKINKEFLYKAIDNIIINAKQTGSLSKDNKKALVNWAIEQKDYNLGKIIYSKRRKLSKEDRERIDNFMKSPKIK